jgi:hypothetical protein
MGVLKENLEEASPDVLLAIGDDQHEQFLDDNLPTFCIYRGSQVSVAPRSSRPRPAWATAVDQSGSLIGRDFPASPELADHLLTYLTKSGFDLASSSSLNPDIGLGHAFSFLYKKIMPQNPIPIVLLMVNTFYSPNQPTPKRCLDLGHALRRAIENWRDDKTVAIVASGGLSHVVIDEDLDEIVIESLLKNDENRLSCIPIEKLNLGTSETRNWIVASGAIDHLRMRVVDYQPCYRSPAGTGCAMTFAVWT